MARVAGALCLALLVGTTPRAALAQDAEAVADEERDAEARSLFEAGRRAFSDGRFEDALDCFERAYALSDRGELLFNVGTAADRLLRHVRALEAFEEYLERVPDADNATEVAARIEILRGAVEADAAEARAHEDALAAARAESAASAVPDERAPEPAPRDVGLGALGIGLVGLGAVLGGVAAGFGAAALDENAALDRDRGTLDASSQADRIAAIDRDALVCDVLLGVALASAAAGTAMAALGLSPTPTEEVSPVAITVGPLSVGVRVAF